MNNTLGNSTVWFLLLSNVLTIFFALFEGASVLTIMWIYWIQSVIIGIFSFFKILALKEFSTEGFRQNNKPLEPTRKTKISTAVFFMLHYGFFHFTYGVFLFGNSFDKASLSFINDIKIPLIISSASMFFFNHLFSFFYYKNKQVNKPNIGKMMFFPYIRIIPMHLTIIAGGVLINSRTTLLFFLILKTMADIVMHIVEHKEQDRVLAINR